MSLGLEVADNGVRTVVVDDSGKVLARSEQLRGAGGTAQAVQEAIGSARKATKTNPATAGIATIWPGDAVPDDVASSVRAALPGISPVAVDAGTAAVVAEVWCGAARGLKNVVAFAIAEHVTAGLLVDGKIWNGAHGYAGSVGWLALNPVEREDYRRFGGLEAEVAAAGIVRRLVWRIKSGDESSVVAQVGGDISRLTAGHVFHGARAGDGVCISVVRDTAKYVGMAVSNLAAVLDPETIVLGGTLAASGNMMLDAVRVECTRRLRPPQVDRVRIVLSTLGADAVAIGAARTAAVAGA